jgi:aminoglycoside 6'-N-acetyltransferase I
MNRQYIELNTENLPQFTPLYLSVFNAAPWFDGWQSDAVNERLQTFAASPRFHGLGLLIDGEPVALILGWGERWIKTWNFQIKEICVATNHQRAGIGRDLLREFESRLHPLGFHSMFLNTASHVPAFVFYQQQGFKPLDSQTLGKTINGPAGQTA